jgi:hypothetical protein
MKKTAPAVAKTDSKTSSKFVLIIAGGRKYKFKARDPALLKCVVTELGGKSKVKIRTGGATGADTEGYLWAMDEGIEREPPMDADWKNVMHPDACPKKGPYGMYDACAGFRRNSEMAATAHGVALFPGGEGTNDMYKKAVAHGLRIWDWREKRRNM